MSPLTYTLLAQVGSGRIQGGWEYIWSAYGIAWASLSLYALSLWVRRPKTGAASKE
jgi:hypothetical protein